MTEHLGKRLERLGRRWLVAILAKLLEVKTKPVVLTLTPRILVIRLDERVGNLLMVLPLLQTLRKRFPQASIDLLANIKGQQLLSCHPALSEFLPFRKKALLAFDGPLWAPFRLHQRHYDLAIEASNPTDPSATQVILTRLSGATHTVGPKHSQFGRLYSAPADIQNPLAHEIDLRLALLNSVPGNEWVRTMDLNPLPALSPHSKLNDWLKDLRAKPCAVINIGARLQEKSLPIPAYVQLTHFLNQGGFAVILAFGPKETALAKHVAQLCPKAWLAPPTNLLELAHLLKNASLVVTCDTGPMHMAVALGIPTAGIFLTTDLHRYGYSEAPHLVVDAGQQTMDQWLGMVKAWIEGFVFKPKDVDA